MTNNYNKISFFLVETSALQRSVIPMPDEFVFPKPRFWQKFLWQPLLLEARNIRKKWICTPSYKSVDNIRLSSCSLIPKLYPSDQFSYAYLSCTAEYSKRSACRSYGARK